MPDWKLVVSVIDGDVGSELFFDHETGKFAVSNWSCNSGDAEPALIEGEDLFQILLDFGRLPSSRWKMPRPTTWRGMPESYAVVCAEYSAQIEHDTEQIP